jgi:hypothetical protein
VISKYLLLREENLELLLPQEDSDLTVLMAKILIDLSQHRINS